MDPILEFCENEHRELLPSYKAKVDSSKEELNLLHKRPASATGIKNHKNQIKRDEKESEKHVVLKKESSSDKTNQYRL